MKSKMVRKSTTPAALEGCKIQIVAQKIYSNLRPVKIQTECLAYPVKVTRRAVATITQEYQTRQRKFRNYSFLDEGDKISGKILYGFSSFPITRINVGGAGRTGRHRGQDTELNGNCCFLEIITDWRGNSLLTHPRDNLLLPSKSS